MSQNKKIISGGIQLFSGQVLNQLLAFLRNWIVARMLIPEDFGLASTFAVTVTALEQLSDFSLEKVIVRDSNGDKEDYQSTVTFLNVFRNFILAAMIYFSAGWIAGLFGVPEAKHAYQWLALVPFVRAFLHLDVFRAQREMIFSKEIAANVMAQFAGLIVACVLAYLTRSYMAVLWGVVTHSIFYVVTTHFMAERRFSMKLNKVYVGSIFAFGWPLMINGMVLMLATQADRILVGAELGMTDLAQYTVAVMLVAVPGLTITKIVSTMALPWMSGVQTDPEKFQSRYDVLGDVLSVVAIMVFVPLTVFGSDVIGIVFGPAYLGPWSLVAWLSVGMAIRFMRARMVNTYLAIGTTKDLMLSETVRILGILVAVVCVQMGGGLVAIGVSMCAGEILAFIFCVVRLGAQPKQPVHTSVSSYGYAAFALAFSAALMTFFPQVSFMLRLGLAAGIIVFSSLLLLRVSPPLRDMMRTMPRMLLGMVRRTPS